MSEIRQPKSCTPGAIRMRETRRRRRDRADASVSSQQNLRPFEFPRCMFPAAQHRREFRAFPLVQFHPVAGVHG